MRLTKLVRLLLVLLFALAVVACGDDGDDGAASGDGDDTTESDAGDGDDADGSDGEGGDGAASGPGGGTLTLDGEQYSLERFRCFFEEQPRAGLGGVFTHSAQGDFTTAEGEPAIIDMTRARGEDGTVTDDVTVDIGEPGSEDAVSFGADGPEGTIEFGDDSASASGLQETDTSDFQAEPVELSFDLSCG